VLVDSSADSTENRRRNRSNSASRAWIDGARTHASRETGREKGKDKEREREILLVWQTEEKHVPGHATPAGTKLPVECVLALSSTRVAPQRPRSPIRGAYSMRSKFKIVVDIDREEMPTLCVIQKSSSRGAAQSRDLADNIDPSKRPLPA